MSDVRTILARYDANFQAKSIESLGNAGGFSGASLWRIEASNGQLCLRMWPTETRTERLRYIHAVLTAAGQTKMSFIPVPFTARDGQTIVSLHGKLWELTPWLPGEARFHAEPNDAKLFAACEALAQFHAAVAPPEWVSQEPAPGIQMRLDTLVQWQSGDLERVKAALNRAAPSPLRERAFELTGLFPRFVRTVESQLRSFRSKPLPLQPCIRDIWHDHLLFTGDKVTGIVDFGAMRRDTVAGDLARLLGSLIGDDAIQWQKAIARYAEIRPLSEVERLAIGVFDSANLLLSGMSWLRWIYLQSRHFDDTDAVLARVDEHLQRLRQRVNANATTTAFGLGPNAPRAAAVD